MARISPHEALRLALDKIGSQSALARVCGVKQPSVWNWLAKNKELPAEHVLAVELASGVSRHDLRPDIYPRINRSGGRATARRLNAEAR
ncbi:MAG: cytoplasmic chaperone TorD [Alphaproteobacteria bacterium HGW-Alphaproteobacteria-16]|nr:MAG: cytoplasmic chaperone TorD [Alphaproteobacteria bacterium HGW-Alphaproteobacteria-16]